MKKIIVTLLFLFMAICQIVAQTADVDSLQNLINKHTMLDTIRVNLLNQLAWEIKGDDIQKIRIFSEEALNISMQQNYEKGQAIALANLSLFYTRVIQQDKARNYTNEALTLAKRLNRADVFARVYIAIGVYYINYRDNGYYIDPINCFQEALKYAKEVGDDDIIIYALWRIGTNYSDSNDNLVEGLRYMYQALEYAEKKGKIKFIGEISSSICIQYVVLGDLTHALKYVNKALSTAQKSSSAQSLAFIYGSLSDYYFAIKDYPKAVEYQKKAIQIFEKLNILVFVNLGKQTLAYKYIESGDYSKAIALGQEAHDYFKSVKQESYLAECKTGLAMAYLQTNRLDKALPLALESLQLAKRHNQRWYIEENCRILSQIYAKRKNYAEAYKYQSLSIVYKDSLENNDIARKTMGIEFNFELENKETQIELLNKDKLLKEAEAANKQKALFGLLGGLGLVSIISLFLFRNNQQKQRANILLEQQKAEIDLQAHRLQFQKEELENSLKALKATQAQLIHSEKMASLGELTAGIAHEIQNPLNFVNNFSEVNTELINELSEEADKGNLEEVKAIANDIKTNEQKINHHGKRAENIVKGMLEHSRKSLGVKEPTDINKLCEEFVRLSYHGLRAKDPKDAGHKSFSADYKLDLDANLPLVNVVSQDIGRVLLNLINNGFQACAERLLLSGVEASHYKPLLVISTKNLGDKIEIAVKDNGSGIPEEIKDKIFQPFFTTKEAGKGTGLGLSLAYDIVKAHGGTIEVKSNYYPPGGEIKVGCPPSGRTGNEGEARLDDPAGRGTSFIILIPIV
ncbi:MAG: tetratricopeptide repeat protein [Saprospiraceae bacterium]|jgi:signal transduction histidine kinase|nr:tetratricopeptide repeat protein [Saprospiraceae bacterium]